MNRCGSFVFSVCALLFLPHILLAQSLGIDSLKSALKLSSTVEKRAQLLNKLSEEYVSINPDTAEYYAYKALDLSKIVKNKNQQAIALKNVALAISKKGEEAVAIKIFTEAVSVAKEAKDKLVQGDIYRGMGNAYYHLSQYDNALAQYFISLNLFKEIKDDIKTAQVLNNIGNVYYFTKRTKEAEAFYSQALVKYHELKNDEGLAKQYGNLGLIYIIKSDTAKAVLYSRKSLEYNLKVGSPSGIATSYVNLAYAYKITEHYKEAFNYANKSLEIRTKIGDKKGIATSTTMLGYIYYSMSNFPKAVEYLEKGRALSEALGMRSQEYEDMDYLARSYLVLGKYKKAQALFKKKAELEDAFPNDKFTQKMAELETEFQTKQKDNEIKLLTQEAEIQNLSLKRRSTYLWAAAGFIILLWVILGISYNAYRNKQKTNLLLEKKNNEITRQKQEITDSINYAQTIQRAILPPEKLLQKYLPDSFVIFKPKDIVSGDFYWTEKVKERVYFAAVDCTGHGVPGAFMSIIGHNGLNRAVKDFKLTHPAEILDKLVELVTEALHAENQGEIKDGMDVALCCLHIPSPSERGQGVRLEYAGAYNPVYLIRNKEVIEFKADRQPIGAFEKRQPFTNHEIQLQTDDCIYVFSDGVVDQFGGEKGKKLSSKRMKEMLLSVVNLPMEQQYTELHNRFTAWQGKEEQTDDVTLIGVRV
jgi:serine phosphatase RsbU (regulator of sigma subunit)/Flp pilus assembly protein TadD